MENLPSSLIGYNKDAVESLIKQKNLKLETQQADIDYLRTENKKLRKQLKSNSKQKEKAPEPEA